MTDAILGWIGRNRCMTVCVAVTLWYGVPVFLANWATMGPFDIVTHTIGHPEVFGCLYAIGACIAAGETES